MGAQKGSRCARYGVGAMGLLNDAIREHLELKRLHGADPGEVARQEQDALGPTTRDEHAVFAEPVADTKEPPAPERHVFDVAKDHADPGFDFSHLSQETVELDMRTVLGPESIEGDGGHAGQERLRPVPTAPSRARAEF
jgi:hypothetical protein